MTTHRTVLSTEINHATDKERSVHPVAWVKSCLSLLLLTPLLLALPSYADTQTRTSAFDYDPVTGLLTKEIIEPGDPNLCLVTTYTYDSFGNKTGATTRNCNGSAGSFPASNTEAASPAATITVNGATVANPAIITARSSTTTYDSKGQFPISSSNALGQTETKTWNSDFGTLKTLTGPNSLTTTWSYDTFGRKTNEARADGSSTTTSYTLCSTSACNATLSQYKITTTQASSVSTDPGIAPTSTEYDMLDRVIQSNTQDKDGTYVQSSLTIYDHLGRVSQVAQPARVGDTLTYTSTTYDKLNRNLTVTAPDGTTSTMTYAGLTTTTTNTLTQTKTEIRNTQGQLISVTDTYGKTLTYQYDAYGNLIKTTDALGNNIIVAYDKRGRKTAMSDPDQGNWSYQYDVLDQLIQQTDAKNQTATFTYDKLGRTLTRNEPDLKTTWVYDTCDASLNAAGKCIGKPVKESTDNGYIRTYLYDVLSRPTAEVDNLDTGYGVSKTYDSYSRVYTLAYPTGFSTRNIYSTTGDLTQVQNTSTSAAYWNANTTDAAGRVTKETYGNGISTVRGYDALGRIKNISAGPSTNATSVSNQTFVYDAIGNLKQRYDAVSGLNEAFGYDNLNRLTSTSAQAGSGPLTQVTLTYNEIGNILTKSDVGTYTYTSTNLNGQTRPHAVSKIMMNDGVTQYAAYSYDGNGNQITGVGRSIILNSWDMPTAIIGATQGKSTPTGITASTFNFVYNASHERVKETLPDGTVVYNISPRVDTGIHVEKRVKTVNGVTTTTYVNSLYAGDMPFGTYTSTTVQPASGSATTTTKTSYFHGDHLGSIIAITDQVGNITERRSYDAWGKRRNSNGTAMTNAFVTPEERHGFTGHEELDDVGLVHMNGRLYDPTTGRFVSADPVIQFPTDMQSYNRYAYIDNNPLSGVDMSGFDVELSSVGCDCGGYGGNGPGIDYSWQPPTWSTPPAQGHAGTPTLAAKPTAVPLFITTSAINSGYAPTFVLRVSNIGGLFGAENSFVAKSSVLNLTASDVIADQLKEGGNHAANAVVEFANLIIMLGDITGDAKSFPHVQLFTPKSRYYAAQGGAIFDGLSSVAGARWIGNGVAGRLEGGGAGRLPQDMNVNPTAPAALPTHRPIGLSPTQNAEAQRIVAEMRAEGYTDIRVNQQQTNALGTRVGVNRPDISGTSPTGQRVHYELDTASSSRGAGHKTRIQVNDPAAKVILKTVN